MVFSPLPDTFESAEPIATQPEQTHFLNFHPDDTTDELTFTVTSETAVLIETANDGTADNFDTELKLFEFQEFPGVGRNPVLIAENDNISSDNPYSRITRTLTPGTT